MMVKSVDTISRAKSQASTLDSIRNSCGVFIRRRIPYQIWYISKSSMWVVKVVACGVGSFKPFEISLNSVLFVGFYCLTGLKDKYSSDRPKRWESWKENIWILILWIKRRSLSFTLTVSGRYWEDIEILRRYWEDITELHLDSIWKFCSDCLWEEGGGDCTKQAHEHRDQIRKLE